MQSNHQNEVKYIESKALFPFIKRLFGYCLKYKLWLWVLLSAILVNSFTEAILPLIWKYLIDETLIANVSGEKFSDSFHIGWHTIAIFSIYYFLILALNYVSEIYVINNTGKMRLHVIRDLREEMFRKMQFLSYSFYDKTSAGWLIARMTYDSERLSELMTWGYINFTGSIIMIIGCLIPMFILNFKLTIIVLVSLPIILFISLKLRSMILKYARESRRINSELTGYFAENLNAIELVKSNAIENYRSSGFSGINKRLKKASLTTSIYNAIFQPLLVFSGSIVAGVILYHGGYMSFKEATISIGTFGAFFAYVRNIFMPVFDLSRTYSLALSSLSAGERIFSLIDESIKIKDNENSILHTDIKGEIEFREVDFGYLANQKVLKKFQLKIKAGESIALVGPSGEGKTTLINLLCRFYEPVSGEIIIDNIQLNKICISSYLKQIGVISQVPHIFTGTIKSNITLSNTNVSDEDIIQTLKILGAEELILRLNEEAGNEGESLSNGEKQMISFARAIIKRPKILIMDEATSSMDAITESNVRKSIKSLLENRTAIVIAHRLSTIKECDRILFIKEGRIAEEGNHESLILQRGMYYQYYKSYSKDFSEIQNN